MKKIIPFVLSVYLNTINLIFPKLGGKHAFYLFCYPMKSKLTGVHQDFLKTAKRSNLIVEGKKVPLYKWGSGPRNVVFIHGWKSNTFRWKRYIERLNTNEFTVYSLDAPGHGNAEAIYGNVPAFKKSLKLLSDDIGSIDTLIAHSIGSFASMYLMHSYPEIHIDIFVSLAGPGKAVDFIDVFKETLSVSQKTLDNMMVYFKDFTGHDVSYYDIANFAKSIKSKLLIIHDTKDMVVPVKYAYQLHELLPRSDMHITNGLGHSLKSDEILDMVLRFAKEKRGAAVK